MPKINAQRILDKRNKESKPPQAIDQAVIDELVGGKLRAADMTAACSDAIKAQAEKHNVKPGALRKYVAALAADKLEDARAETQQLADLIG
jgi:hypothetical protein